MFHLEDVNTLPLCIHIDSAYWLFLRESENGDHSTIGFPEEVHEVDDISSQMDLLVWDANISGEIEELNAKDLYSYDQRFYESVEMFINEADLDDNFITPNSIDIEKSNVQHIIEKVRENCKPELKKIKKLIKYYTDKVD